MDSTDFERVFLGIDHQQLETHQVRVLPRDGVSATRAHAAGEPVGARGLAQQRLREIEGERVLADAARTVNEQRVRKARALAAASSAPRRPATASSGDQGRPRGFGRRFGRHAGRPSAVRCATTSARTTSIGARAVDDADPLRQRRGALEIGVAHRS